MDGPTLARPRRRASTVVEPQVVRHGHHSAGLKAIWRSLFCAFFAWVALCPVAEAGHVLGLGKYNYDPNALRPQLRISERVDSWQLDVSGYPGNPEPGEEIEFLVTLGHARGGRPVSGRVECTIHRVSVLGQRQRVVESQLGELDGNGYRFRVSLPDDAEYEVAFAFGDGATRTSTLSIPLVVGKPGSPWTILGGFGGGLAVFIVGVVLLGRVRNRRGLAAVTT